MDLIQFGIVLKAFDQMSGTFSSAASKSMGAIGRLDSRVAAFSDRLDRLGTKTLADGMLLSGLMQKPIEAFASAEDAATGLQVAMLGAGDTLDSRFTRINKLATELGDKLPGTTADFQNMMTALVKQGISYDAILGGVGRAAAYLGVMLKKPPEQAAEFVAKLQDATGTTEKDMMGLMDTIQRATYLGVNDDNLLQFYTKMTPALDTMRQKGADAAKELAPFAVMFDQMGMRGEAAGNALRKAVQLGMDTGKVAKANAMLKKQGVKLDFTDGHGEFGGMPNLMAQLDKLKHLDKVTQLKVLKEIFGDDAETLQVLAKIIDKGADGYNEVVDRLLKQATLQQRVNKQLGTLKNLWDAASGTFTNTLAAFGAAISPELKSLVDWLGDTSAKLTELISEYPRLTKAVGLFVAGLGGVLVVGGAVALTLGTIFRLSRYLLGPLGKLGGLLGKKGGLLSKSAELADKASVQRVWVVNMPGNGLGGGDSPIPDDLGGGKSGKTGKAGGRLGRLAGWGKTIGGALMRHAGTILAVGAAGYQAYDTYRTAKTPLEKGRGYGSAAGMLAGGLAGAKLGAAIGSAIAPGIGTAIGGLLGGIGGTFLGDKLGGLAGGALSSAKMPTMLVHAAPPVRGPLRPQAQPLPLSAAQGRPATGGAQPAPLQKVEVHYAPTLTIQGDPLPGTESKFLALLKTHQDTLLRMITQAQANRARTAY